MNISEQQLNNMMSAVTTALQPLIRALPVTPVEWADQNYYLPKESSYGEGEWKTLPFQIAIMNSMGNDQIRTVNLIKSARVGYTKMLLGVVGYFIEHKSRNSLLFQPTDSAAEDFMKSHVEATIRNVPCLKDLSPWLGRKHRDNTLTLKRFSSGVGFWCLGGAAAKNYREKSVDVVCYDELSSFEPDVEKEGSPTLLGDKRIEGSVWPKSIRGSTPKIKGTCQIEKAANESAHFMRFYVPCPHCGEAQYLKFGDESTPFGLKWEKDSPESVFYLCEHHGCVIHQSELDQSNGRWICENTGMWTRDGLTFFSAAGNEIPPPRSITFHIWTAYSPFTTWVQIVYDWLDALKDPNGLKTFVNTTLGETWEEAVGEKLDHQVLMDKVVRYCVTSNGRWICENTGMWTRDGLTFFSAAGNEIPPPRSITFHIWTAYSPFTTWVQIVYDWLDALKDPNGLKTFVNTTLGETWEEAVGEKLDHQVLMDKVVRYTAAVPARVVYLTAGIDSQRNRFEMYVWGWAPGEEAFLVDKIIIMGRPDEEETLLRVDAAINKKYRHADGTEMTISRVCWDTGGIDGEIVYQRSKKHGVFRVLPVKGASVYGKPVITMPKTRNQRGVYLCEVGTDTAKEILYARMKADPTPADEATSYAIRFPDDPEIFSQTEAQQLVAEELVEKWEKGKMRLLWDNKKRRNEALDCLVYAYAALRVSVQRWQLDLAVLAKSREEETTRPTLKELAAKLSGGVNGYSR
ncbi:phage terminase large subunit family protein [Escherichia coli]|uniref:phage terminase large subunit family protein n=1 Tax=Escherichia coli TaxID=562 RepID=UPI00207B5287|nr:phage terminase large subunit family protein [Escherichia coli]